MEFGTMIVTVYLHVDRYAWLLSCGVLSFSVVFVTAVSICKYSKQMFYKISAIVTVIYTITPTLTSIISFLYSSKIL